MCTAVQHLLHMLDDVLRCCQVLQASRRSKDEGQTLDAKDWVTKIGDQAGVLVEVVR